MGKTVGIALGVLALTAICATVALFAHGLRARAQSVRYKKALAIRRCSGMEGGSGNAEGAGTPSA